MANTEDLMGVDQGLTKSLALNHHLTHNVIQGSCVLDQSRFSLDHPPTYLRWWTPGGGRSQRLQASLVFRISLAYEVHREPSEGTSSGRFQG